MKETFINPLLHPYSAPSPTSPTYEEFPAESPRGSIDYLPIASRFLSPTPWAESPSGQVSEKKYEHPNIDGESLDSDEEDEADDRLGKGFPGSKRTAHMSLGAKHNHPRSPYGRTATRTPTNKYGTVVPFPSRSHHSLPPPPRANPITGSTQSLGRQSIHEHDSPKTSAPPPNANGSRVLRKFKKSDPRPPPVAVGGAVPPNSLPEDLKICLEVIEQSMIEGHLALHDALKKRYDEQYPLVRSLADVFVTHVSLTLNGLNYHCILIFVSSHISFMDTLRLFST